MADLVTAPPRLGNEDTSEVYKLHHHDKVVALVPDQHARWLLLEELAGMSDVFEDWSGYGGPLDEDGELQDADEA